VAAVPVRVQVLRAPEGLPAARVARVARVRPGQEPEPDREPPGRDRELELPGRVRVPAPPVPAGAPTLRAPSPR
jgi:hypothetical protein